jgi:ferredoxin
MSVKVTSACVRCGACLWECPQEAIAPGAERPVVDPERCTECYGYFGEAQCMVVCPVTAILVDRPESIGTLATRFKTLNPELKAQNTWIWRRIEISPD